LPKICDCERVNVVLVHRWQKYLFKIVNLNGVDSYEKHEIGKGISGVVALSGNSLCTDLPSKVFSQDVDDPTFNEKCKE